MIVISWFCCKTMHQQPRFLLQKIKKPYLVEFCCIISSKYQHGQIILHGMYCCKIFGQLFHWFRESNCAAVSYIYENNGALMILVTTLFKILCLLGICLIALSAKQKQKKQPEVHPVSAEKAVCATVSPHTSCTYCQVLCRCSTLAAVAPQLTEDFSNWVCPVMKVTIG